LKLPNGWNRVPTDIATEVVAKPSLLTGGDMPNVRVLAVGSDYQRKIA
jgi:hypothetical protein